jgi:hypothetical protein
VEWLKLKTLSSSPSTAKKKGGGTRVEWKKIERMNQFGLKYIHTWKCHKEIPCVAILNTQKYLLSKTEDRKVKQVLSEGWHQWKGEVIRKGCRRVKMVEILCTHV